MISNQTSKTIKSRKARHRSNQRKAVKAGNRAKVVKVSKGAETRTANVTTLLVPIEMLSVNRNRQSKAIPLPQWIRTLMTIPIGQPVRIATRCQDREATSSFPTVSKGTTGAQRVARRH